MASILGKVGFANSAAYVAAKNGVIGLIETAKASFVTGSYYNVDGGYLAC